MYYLVTIGYESDQMDRNGNPRITKSNYLIEAESAEEATILAAKYKSDDMRDSQILSLKRMGIECVIDKKNEPKYYQS